MPVRAYCDDDAPAVRACIVELQEHERALDPRLRAGETIADEYFAMMLRRCHEWNGIVLVAECDGEVAGFVTVMTRVPFEELDEPPGEYALITDLAVRAPDARASRA